MLSDVRVFGDLVLDAVVQERRLAARLRLVRHGSLAYRPLRTAHATASEALGRAMDAYVTAVNRAAQGAHPESKADGKMG